jgi:hypothetical protein
MWLALSVPGGLILLVIGFVGFMRARSWLDLRRESQIHRAALNRCTSDEIRIRAIDWINDSKIKETPALKDLRILIVRGGHREVLKRWRYYHSIILEATEWNAREGPPRTWILRDYLRVLEARSSAPARGPCTDVVMVNP